LASAAVNAQLAADTSALSKRGEEVATPNDRNDRLTQ
jgi:hypothetical protein